MDTELCNSERESVIEAAIETISGIVIDSQNSGWYRGGEVEQDNRGTIDTNVTNGNGSDNEGPDDCSNLHSDTSSYYQDRKSGFEALVTVRPDLQAPKTRRSDKTPNISDHATPRSSYRVNKASGKTAMAGNYSKTYSVGVKHVNTPQSSCVTTSQRQTLHGLEVGMTDNVQYTVCDCNTL